MIGFLGGGKMAEALVKGLIASGNFPAGEIIASDINADRLNLLSSQYRIKVTSDNTQVADQADIVILAVKPRDVDPVLLELKERVGPQHLLLSIAAGVPIARLARPFLRGSGQVLRDSGQVPSPPRVIRVMPNVCALAQAGAAVICPGPGVSKNDCDLALKIFNSVGRAFLIKEEADLDAVTALSGSGPAYFFLVLEALTEAGVAQGLARELARQLVLQTALGAAKMALEAGANFAELKEMVTSPAGTTAAALKKLEQYRLRAAFLEAVEAATKRSRELGQSGRGNK